MKHFKNKWVVIIIFLAGSTYGQEEFKKPSQFYFSFGAGLSVPNGLTNSFYHDGSTNVQLGVSHELSLTPRFSWMNGVELEQNDYNLDKWVIVAEHLFIDNPIDQAKYTRIIQRNISLHTQLRYYFSDNLEKSSAAMFLQGGLRATLAGPTNFNYRMSGEPEEIDLGGFTNSIYLSAELMIGFKNDFFENFDLLNTSTLGFIYQMNPMFINTNFDVYPMHFTWRFLF